LTIWHCIFSAELTKTRSFRLFFFLLFFFAILELYLELKRLMVLKISIRHILDLVYDSSSHH